MYGSHVNGAAKFGLVTSRTSDALLSGTLNLASTLLTPNQTTLPQVTPTSCLTSDKNHLVASKIGAITSTVPPN